MDVKTITIFLNQIFSFLLKFNVQHFQQLFFVYVYVGQKNSPTSTYFFCKKQKYDYLTGNFDSTVSNTRNYYVCSEITYKQKIKHKLKKHLTYNNLLLKSCCRYRSATTTDSSTTVQYFHITSRKPTNLSFLALRLQLSFPPSRICLLTYHYQLSSR